jgi:hypothetical protein
MRKSVSNRSPEAAAVDKYVTYNKRPAPDKKRYSKRAKGPLARGMSRIMWAGIVGMSLFLGAIAANKQNDIGFAGVISAKANGVSLSCGGEYDASSVGILHPDMPCGTMVQVMNPENGTKVFAPVISNAVMFKKSNNRNADLTVALAEKLGLSAEAGVPAVVSLRAYSGLNRFIPMLANYQPSAPSVPKADEESRKALTQNMIGECHICGVNGMVAVAQVTLNRTEQRFNGKASINAVVFDRSQFSWTLWNEKRWPSKKHAGWISNYVLAGAVLTDQLSAEELAIQYWIGRDASYYYAFDVIATPYWGKRGGKLEVVPMANTLEVELRHRFFREKGINLARAEAVAVTVQNVNEAPASELPVTVPVPIPRPSTDKIAEIIRTKG